MTIVKSHAPEYDATARPIWEVIAEMGDQAPPGMWDNVPPDLSKRLDEYIYGRPGKPK